MPEHGTLGRYTNHGCRCSRCKEAMRLQMVTYRARPISEKHLTHGTESSYYAGCRCFSCTLARAERRHKRKKDSRTQP
jgi:hypothetical protein